MEYFIHVYSAITKNVLCHHEQNSTCRAVLIRSWWKVWIMNRLIFWYLSFKLGFVSPISVMFFIILTVYKKRAYVYICDIHTNTALWIQHSPAIGWQKFCRSATLVLIFWQFSIFQFKFDSPQIISSITDPFYKLPQELLINLKLSIPRKLFIETKY